MTPALIGWLIVAGLPLTVVAMERLNAGTGRVRSLALVVAGVGAATGILAFLMPELSALRVQLDPEWAPLGGSLLSISPLSAPLVALPATLWLITLCATPRARLSRAGLSRTALSTTVLTCAFVTENAIVLLLLWIVSTQLFLRGLSDGDDRGARRNSARLLWSSAGLFATGVALSHTTLIPDAQDAGVLLILAAVLIRKGVFPFHAWIPNAFDRGRIGPTVLFCAPQLGTYVAAVLVVPHATPGTLRVVAELSLFTALYGSVLALVQHDARRATGYIFVSQSALVLAGLDCTSTEALAGSLILWGSSALAFTGMARTVLALEARRGRLDLRKHHGGYDQMPALAVGFLVLSLACTGFPGTLGFVGEEMLLEGAIHEFPVLGLMVVATSAFTGLAVLRMYFSLFCGKRTEASGLGLLRGEALAIGALATALVVAGLLPHAIVQSRMRAAESVLHLLPGAARDSH